jgi:hypothetical protein
MRSLNIIDSFDVKSSHPPHFVLCVPIIAVDGLVETSVKLSKRMLGRAVLGPATVWLLGGLDA